MRYTSIATREDAERMAALSKRLGGPDGVAMLDEALLAIDAAARDGRRKASAWVGHRGEIIGAELARRGFSWAVVQTCIQVEW